MKIFKKNTFTDLYIQQTIGVSGEIQVFKLQLKKEYAENQQLRSHFVSNLQGLKNISGKYLLTFLQLIDNDQETAILCQTKNVKSLPDYIAGNENISDAELIEIFNQMAKGLETLHQSMLYYPVLQPSSFLVDIDGNVQLSLVDILEFRMYQFQQITPDSKQSYMNYLSHERNNNFFSISMESDIYSLGLIYWHVFLFAKSPVKNWKLITENKFFAPTETIWDPFFDACFNSQVSLRYKNTQSMIKGLPGFVEKPPSSGNSKNSTYAAVPLETPLIHQKQTHYKENNLRAANQQEDNEQNNIIAFIKKRKVVLLVISFLLIYLTYQIFSPPTPGTDPPTKTGANTTTESNPPTAPDPKGLQPSNPIGYTVKPGSEDILTEKGILKKSTKRFYRYFNGKWAYSDENTPLKWNDLKDKEKPVMLKEYFTKNSQEENVNMDAAGDKLAAEKEHVKMEEDKKKAAAAKAAADAAAKAKAEEKEKKDKCKTICDNLSASLKDPINNKNLQKKWLAKVNGFILDYNYNKCDCTDIKKAIDKKRSGL